MISLLSKLSQEDFHHLHHVQSLSNTLSIQSLGAKALEVSPGSSTLFLQGVWSALFVLCACFLCHFLRCHGCGGHKATSTKPPTPLFGIVVVLSLFSSMCEGLGVKARWPGAWILLSVFEICCFDIVALLLII